MVTDDRDCVGDGGHLSGEAKIGGVYDSQDLGSQNRVLSDYFRQVTAVDVVG